MTSFEQLKSTFFDECSEALQQIEVGLMAMRDGASDGETVNAVFRAVHSVKGGAGIFGFEGLVGFAHVFETVLDALRSDRLPARDDIVDLMLSAADVLSDLVAMSRAGEDIPADFGADCRTGLEAVMQQNGEDGGDEEPAGDFDGIDFTPVAVDDFTPVAAEPGAVDGEREFVIGFRPGPDFLKKANEPLHLVGQLRRLGELTLSADIETLPPLAELDPERPYVAWTGVLRGAVSPEAIGEVFEFAAGDCDLSIVERGAEAPIETAPMATSAPPLQPIAMPEPLQTAVADAMPGLATPSTDEGQAAADKPAAARPAAKPAATTTRVELEKIDRVVNMVGELVIAQAMLAQTVRDLPEEIAAGIAQSLDEVAHHTRELKDSVMSMRAQPVGIVFQRMPRLVRELSAKTGKKVRLEMQGESTEVDRSIVEQLGDPLTHIIRNSVDHGIESPADRAAAGKSAEGTIVLSASHRGGRIVIEIRDDGGGINSERVLKKAKEKGLVAADAALTEDEINNLIFMPGFSTAETISDISGRGVGMDVVRRNIQDIGGRITLKSERGRGMTLQLALPLTLAVMDGMVIRVGREIYVMPMSAIVECLRPSRKEIHNLIGTRGMLKLRGALVPLVDLGDLLALHTASDEMAGRVVMITEAGNDQKFGLLVDELLGHQQVVIKSIEDSYGPVPGISAATILGNGRVAFILDVDKLSELASARLSAAEAGDRHAGKRTQAALVA
jgi:two-component system chemotaxis sensor kinase CheA